MKNKNKISVIVPCYNEQESIPVFYQEVKKNLDTIENVDYEIIFIDDGSKDDTLNILKELSKKEDCHYISFSRNFGKEAGMYAGLKKASGDYCVIMDVDLQHPPKLLPLMYQAVSQEGYDCCGGKRCGREGDGVVRSLFSKAFYKVVKKMTKMEMSDGYGDFRMMSRTMTDAILNMKEYNRYMKGIYSFVGFKTKWIEFSNVEREKGTSKWNFKNLLSYAEEGILAFSMAPLKLAGIMGGILIFAAILLLIFQRNLILPCIFFLSGIQMLFLYIIGLYLAKDCLENKNRPLYIIRETDYR